MDNQRTELLYRPCVGIMLFNLEGKIFVGQRFDSRIEAWQMPQGGIEEGEDPQDAALRELQEEIGTNLARIVYISKQWHNYDLPDDIKTHVWGGRYLGQSQKWFLMRFLGIDQDIKIHKGPNPEFKSWKWMSIAELLQSIVPFKREVYKNIIQEFQPIIVRNNYAAV